MTRRRARGAGEGSIYKLPTGRWAAALDLGPQDGKRRRRVLYGTSRRQVQERLTAALRDHQAGLEVRTDERETVGAYLERWLTDAVRPSVRPATYDRYADIVRLHLIPALGAIRLTKLAPGQVQAMLNGKVAGGLAPRTAGHLRAVLRRALNVAIRHGLLQRNVATLIDLPRARPFEATFLAPDQAKQLLVAIRGDRLEALITVALALGLRQGEALGLRWQDVDTEAGTLTVRHALQRIGGELKLVEPKTRLSRRTIAIPPIVVGALREHRRRQAEERLLAGGRWHDLDLVFPSSIGSPADGTAITKRLQAILAAAGLPRMRFHDLRHSAASLLLVQGVDLPLVKELLGHSNIAQTMAYTHLIPALRREAADQMEALLTGS
jgi:integrase